jgi:hypothetical protein
MPVPSGRQARTPAPGINYHAVAVALLARQGFPHLSGDDDKALVLHRAGAQQQFPMVAAGVPREGGRHQQQLRAGQGVQAVQLGEAEVVADRQAGEDAVDFRDHHLVATADRCRFAVAGLPGEADVEQVQLVVARRDAARGIEMRPAGLISRLALRQRPSGPRAWTEPASTERPRRLAQAARLSTKGPGMGSAASSAPASVPR